MAERRRSFVSCRATSSQYCKVIYLSSMKPHSNRALYFGLAVVLVIKVLFFMRFPPFWDSVLLCSDVPEAYYKLGATHLFLPEKFALYPKYPPGMGYYIARVWDVLGRSVVSTHIAFLPFLLGFFYQLYLLLKFLEIRKMFVWLVLFFSIEPGFATQLYLINPDTIILFLYLLGMNGILQKKQGLLFLSTCFLVLVSPRGPIYVLALLFSEFAIRKMEGTLKWRFLTQYLPAVFVLLFWMGAYYLHYGWFLHERGSEYGEFGLKGGIAPIVKAIARNTFVFGWRLIDFGRIFSLILFCFLLWKGPGFASLFQNNRMRLPLLVCLSFVAVFLPAMWLANIPIGHRHLLPAILFAYLLLFITADQYFKQHLKKISIVLMAIQVIGNCWVYPRGISMGWDSTLGHLPYHQLLKNTLVFLNKNNIPQKTVGAAFPEMYPTRTSHINEEPGIFKARDFKADKFILYSNIFNEFSDVEINTLFDSGKWTPIHTQKKGMVEIIVFKRKESTP